jgi:uncharacterized membrane protein YphA (DoxX/SURF4 family)
MSDSPSSASCCRAELAYANLIARLWVALRLFMAGVDKFRGGEGTASTFSSVHYEKKTEIIAKLMKDNSMLPSFMPEWAIDQYAHSIGYILLAVGAWVAVGLFSEFALLAAGLTFLSLGFGLAALPDDLEMCSNIGIGILITFAALVTSRYGRVSLDGLLRRKKFSHS